MVDMIAARELFLWSDNLGHMNSHKNSIIANACKHIARGQYDRDLAAKGWEGYMLDAAKDYAKAHGAHLSTFPPVVRRAAAEMMRDQFEDEYRANAWDGINPVLPEKRLPLA